MESLAHKTGTSGGAIPPGRIAGKSQLSGLSVGLPPAVVSGGTDRTIATRRTLPTHSLACPGGRA